MRLCGERERGLARSIPPLASMDAWGLPGRDATGVVVLDTG
jgi:hypothetical protein